MHLTELWTNVWCDIDDLIEVLWKLLVSYSKVDKLDSFFLLLFLFLFLNNPYNVRICWRPDI